MLVLERATLFLRGRWQFACDHAVNHSTSRHNIKIYADILERRFLLMCILIEYQSVIQSGLLQNKSGWLLDTYALCYLLLWVNVHEYGLETLINQRTHTPSRSGHYQSLFLSYLRRYLLLVSPFLFQ